MYISRLKLYGFKSFLKKSEINFGRGVTCIVGPNGCGKTNIVDAIRWVIGEQKTRTLRADKNTDVIFNGTSKRKPLNLAEVSLTIHNVSGRIPIDYTDIDITRRIYRNSDSEYLLNKNLCRLKDIKNLFVDTGMGADAYSIIELKMIEDILSENPQERKKLFEEAAGVNRYRAQRKTSLRKLEATEEDLLRVSDIISEVEVKVKTLKRQYRQFQRYQKVSENLIDAEAVLAAAKITEIKKEQEPVHRQIEEQREKLIQVSEDLDRFTEKTDKQQAAHDNIEIKLNKKKEAYSDIREKRNKVETEELVLKEQYQNKLSEFTRLNEDITNITTTIEKTKQRISLLNEKEKKYEKQLRNQFSDQQKMKSRQAELERKYQIDLEKLETLQDKKYVLVKEESEQNAKQAALQENIDFLIHEIQTIEEEYEDKKEKLKKLKVQLTTIEVQLTDSKEEYQEYQEDLEDSEENLQDINKKYESTAQKKREVDRQVDKLNNKIDFYADLLESKEGFSPALQYVMNHREKYSGIVGAFSESVSVDDEYTQALQAVLENMADLIVMETNDDAFALINAIEQAEKGPVVTISLDNIINEKIPHTKSVEGTIPFLEIVKCPDVLQPVANQLFHNVYFCNDNEFESIVPNRIEKKDVIVSKSGHIYNEKNILTGKNQQSAKTHIFGREEKLFHYENEYDKINLEKIGLEEELNQLSEEKKYYRNDIETNKKEIEKLDKLLKKYNNIEVSIHNEIKQLEKNLSELKQKKINETTALNSYEKKLQSLATDNGQSGTLVKLEEQIQEYKLAVDNRKQKLERFNQKIQNFRVENVKAKNHFDNIRNEKTTRSNSLQKLERRLKQRRKSKQTVKNKKSEMEAEIEIKKLAVEKIHKEEKALKEMVEKIQADYGHAKNQLQEANKEIYKLRHQKEILTETINKLELEQSELAAKQREIESVLYEKYERKIDSNMIGNVPSIDLAEQKKNRLRKRLEKIGTINMAVKDEYEAESDRLNFLIDQKNDLEEAAETIRKVITEIDSVARKKFMETFARIKENFKNIFRLFFPGGSTDINLIGDGDPLDSKVEIFACPGGKKMLSLRLLSAGEKTLTAIALLFGIYQVKPSPFCILDEVDAPLDDANTKRFTRLLQNFSDNTQFIIVTHNKVTMSVADVLFGVTMGEKGVSQIVPVNLD